MSPQAVAGLTLFLVSLLLHMYAFPYDTLMLNHLESITLASSFYNLFVGMALIARRSDKIDKAFADFLTYSAMALTIAAGVAGAIMGFVEVEPVVKGKLKDMKRKKQFKRLLKRAKRETPAHLAIRTAMRCRQFVFRALYGPEASGEGREGGGDGSCGPECLLPDCAHRSTVCSMARNGVQSVTGRRVVRIVHRPH